MEKKLEDLFAKIDNLTVDKKAALSALDEEYKAAMLLINGHDTAYKDLVSEGDLEGLDRLRNDTARARDIVSVYKVRRAKAEDLPVDEASNAIIALDEAITKLQDNRREALAKACDEILTIIEKYADTEATLVKYREAATFCRVPGHVSTCLSSERENFIGHVNRLSMAAKSYKNVTSTDKPYIY